MTEIHVSSADEAEEKGTQAATAACKGMIRTGIAQIYGREARAAYARGGGDVEVLGSSRGRRGAPNDHHILRIIPLGVGDMK